jgi:uncharacterized repeat protein (TIGR03803 family)
MAGLVQGSDRLFYGTTSTGAKGAGTVFKITSGGALTTLYAFSAGKDGGSPLAGLVQAPNGYFYGTTSTNGTAGFGTVFKITNAGYLTTLYSFTGGGDGGTPTSSLAAGLDNYLYGTTTAGGGEGEGTVFRITTNGFPTTLYSFADKAMAVCHLAR